MTKRKVLIPLDGSLLSRQIFPIVQTYLKPQETELVLLRVATPVAVTSQLGLMTHKSLTGYPYEIYAREMERAQTMAFHEQAAHQGRLEEEMQVDAAQLRHLGYTVFTEILFGDPEQQISDYVKNSKIDLVAMTTHGRTGLGRVVLGSVAESVVRHVDVPVLLLRAMPFAE